MITVEKLSYDFPQKELYHKVSFTINENDNYKVLTIQNPWDSMRILQRYVLVNRNCELPEDLPAGTLVRTPVEKIVAFASPHCGILNELGVIEKIAGVCESQYIDIDYIKENIASGKIPDLGMATAPDIERLIEVGPEVIMASPFQNSSYGKTEKLGIPIIECADYMENTPLGRAEWIKFYACFFELEEKGDSIFNDTKNKYNSLIEQLSYENYKPKVLTERKTGNVWYVPGGNSYMTNLYKDAGADLDWLDNEMSGSVPLSFEEVFDKAQNADIWLIKYYSNSSLSYEELNSDFHLYSEFKAFKEKNIYVCNTAEKPYYEELPLHPDRVLKDLIMIFHPEIELNDSLRFFQKM